MILTSREAIIAQIRQARGEIAQYFRDVEYWNTNVRKPHEAVIDPDPDGRIAKIAKSYDDSLANERRIAEEKAV